MSNKKESASADTGLKVNETVHKIKADAAKDFKVGEGGVVSAAEDLYERNLPEGITTSTVKTLQQYNADFVAGTGLALGEFGLEHFKKHKTAQELSLEVNAGKDKVGLQFQRHKTFPNGQGGTVERYEIGRAHV